MPMLVVVVVVVRVCFIRPSRDGCKVGQIQTRADKGGLCPLLPACVQSRSMAVEPSTVAVVMLRISSSSSSLSLSTTVCEAKELLMLTCCCLIFLFFQP